MGKGEVFGGRKETWLEVPVESCSTGSYALCHRLEKRRERLEGEWEINFPHFSRSPSTTNGSPQTCFSSLAGTSLRRQRGMTTTPNGKESGGSCSPLSLSFSSPIREWPPPFCPNPPISLTHSLTHAVNLPASERLLFAPGACRVL